MKGPYPKGTFSEGDLTRYTNWSGMSVGKKYLVTKTFIDGDRSAVRAGTKLKLLGHFFSGFGGTMGIFVSLDGEQEWSISFQFEEEGNSKLIDNILNYVEEVTDGDASL